MVFSALILGQFLALILILSPLGSPGFRWEDLALTSLFIHWVSLFSLGLLCLLRSWLSRLRNYLAATLSYLLVLGVTALMTDLAWRLVMYPVLMPDQATNLHYHLFLFRNLSISALVSAVALRYLYIQYHWRLNTLHMMDARLQALQARIRPHFLFNTLNTIASLTRINPGLAEQAVEDLAELFRASVNDPRQQVSLSEELTLCEQYLRIETLRLGEERIQVEWLIDTLPGDALIPPLSLQPLLENAICYGVQARPEGGCIRVTGLCDGRYVKIVVESPRPPPEYISEHRGLHIAQENLHQRFKTFYGRRGRLEIDSNENVYQVSLRFPYEKQNHENSNRG